MLQIRIHGRGGQGVVTAAEMLSVAAFDQGRHAQAFPSFGSERTGAPLSFAQQRLWFLSQVDPASSRYNEPNAVRLQGPVDVSALRMALERLAARHDVEATVPIHVRQSHGAATKGQRCPVVERAVAPPLQDAHSVGALVGDGEVGDPVAGEIDDGRSMT